MIGFETLCKETNYQKGHHLLLKGAGQQLTQM